MTFAQELMLFVALCVVLRLSGTVLDFVAHWASKVRRDMPQPLLNGTPADEVVGMAAGAGSRLEARASH